MKIPYDLKKETAEVLGSPDEDNNDEDEGDFTSSLTDTNTNGSSLQIHSFLSLKQTFVAAVVLATVAVVVVMALFWKPLSTTSLESNPAQVPGRY